MPGIEGKSFVFIVEDAGALVSIYLKELPLDASYVYVTG